MSLLSSFRSIYDLDTLDTRFTTSSSVPYQTVIDSRSDPAAGKKVPDKVKARSQPSKWNTAEFYLYAAVVAFAVVTMFWVTYDVSRPEDPRYLRYHLWLSPGWVPGRKIDNSDPQYRVFRRNLPYMSILLVVHPLLRRVWNIVFPAKGNRKDGGRARMDQRVSFDFVWAFLFLFALHGFSSLKIIIILSLNFQITRRLPRQYVPLATWVFNIGTLFANELGSGYMYNHMASLLSPAKQVVYSNQVHLVDSPLMAWGRWLDGKGGLMRRWELLFNFTILRLISFNMDFYWSVDKRKDDSTEVWARQLEEGVELANIPKKKQLDLANLSERDRVYIPAEARDFTWRTYIAYALYAPLYLVGPILTFNDYISQSSYRPASIEASRTFRYGIRFVLTLLAMELLLHYDYVGAISKAAPVWTSYTAAQLSLLSFFNLHIIWLKLLLPWRLFRFWSLIDGIDPPENMIRCVSNNYSTQSFWRAWHRSYNRWLIRYIYVPLGGTSFKNWQSTAKSILTFLMVFTFVALWHDIKLKLLVWGWLIVLFMLPEWTAAYLFPRRNWEHRPTEYRMLCCLGAVGNVLMMIAANLVGFGVGFDGLKVIITSILYELSGVIFIVIACICLYAGIQVMFELRETEKRKGINIKC